MDSLKSFSVEGILACLEFIVLLGLVHTINMFILQHYTLRTEFFKVYNSNHRISTTFLHFRLILSFEPQFVCSATTNSSSS